MIHETVLRDGLKRLLKQTEEDIRERLAEEPLLETRLKEQHQGAVAAGRMAATGFLSFREEATTQAAVHWLLACVFVRFLEDNRLIDEAWIAGPGDRLAEALDRRSLFYRQNPTADDRDYLMRVFETVAALPDMADLFHRTHNPLWHLAPTGTQTMAILRFFQQRNQATGELVYDFTDPTWSTRFLGDLYQNLSDFARKRYALCQTPNFVIQFILDRTLTLAIDAFGLDGIRLIDPTCGSGHFLLAAFDRLYSGWVEREPEENPRMRAQRALDQVYGVDLNPFAVAIARFRLMIAALKVSDVYNLRNAPNFQFQLATGDSLLHGSKLAGERGMQRLLQHDPIDHYFETEDSPTLNRILGQRYSVVVGNPPYINVADPTLRETYRGRFGSCHGKYQLTVPFIERFFNLSISGGESEPIAGRVGLIGSNAFMKRGFGKKLVEQYLPRWDLSHVIDTSGVYLPGHGTPTVILLGLNRHPVSDTIRVVRGIRGETSVPPDPSVASVWKSIVEQIELPGSESRWVSVADAMRTSFHTHPWSIGGGGAAELKEVLDEAAESTIEQVAEEMGITAVTGESEVFALPTRVASGLRLELHRPLVDGEMIRDWSIDQPHFGLWLYDDEYRLVDLEKIPSTKRFMETYKSIVGRRKRFGVPMVERGLTWYEWQELYSSKLRKKHRLAFGEIATHNHFVVDTSQNVFNNTTRVITLPDGETIDQHLGLLGILNSSTACFWLKQVSFPKGGDTVGRDGARVRKVLWDVYYAFDSTKLKQFPLPEGRPLTITQKIQESAEARSALLPDRLCASQVLTLGSLKEASAKAESLLQHMIALQEELDWQVYHLYGLLPEDLSLPPNEVPPLKLGQRPFEILMGRQIAAGELETTWFERHGSMPTAEIPAEWPEHYKQTVAKRIQVIESNRDIALIERPEHKRRWNLPSWDELEKKALESWLLDRMEAERLWQEPELKTCARVADMLRLDSDFVSVAELYDSDAELTALVTTLALKQSVPFLPVLRYKPSGFEKRKHWEEVWALQRREGAGEKVEIPVPPKYRAADFLDSTYWNLRGGLDVPKERFLVYPHLQRDADSTPVLAWAGWDQLKQARALASYYQHVKDEEGWGAERLKPILAGFLELIPWLKQWHNDVDPATGERMGDTFEGFVEAECQEFGFTVESVRAWTPAHTTARRGRRRR